MKKTRTVAKRHSEHIREALGMRRPRTRARARSEATSETRSRSPKHRFQYSWARQTRTIVIVNTLVGAIIACTVMVVVWIRWDEGVLPRVDTPKTVTHAGYVERRTVSYAGAAARALFDGNDLDIGSDIPPPLPQPPTAAAVTTVRKAESEIRPRTVNTKPPVAQIYAISQHGCRAQWEEFADRSRLNGWPAVRWNVAQTRTIRLAAPPIALDPGLASLARHARGRGTRAALRRKIAYLDAHRRAWSTVARTRATNALIMDVHLFPSSHAAEKLETWLRDVDNAAIALNSQWHIMSLRPIDTVHHKPRRRRNAEHWADGIRRAGTTRGASAYIVSQAGARLLLAHVRAYRGTLDAEFSRLAKEMDGGFVVLTPCEEAAGICDTLTEDITVERVTTKFQCVWRSMEERHLAQLILKRHNI